MLRVGIGVILGYLVFQKSLDAQIVAHNFDWDDNIVFMTTKIYLYERRSGAELSVSTAEFAGIRELIGKSGAYQNYELRSDPGTGSFREFRDIPGSNQFLDQVLHTVSQDPAEWQGPSWQAFVRALSNRETAANVTVITARGHAGHRMLEALRELKERGLIKYLPKAGNLMGVSARRFKGKADNPSEVKAMLMMDILDRIEATAFHHRSVHLISPDGTRRGHFHLWGFSDDDPGNYDAAVRILSAEVKKGRWPHVKISLFYTGARDLLREPSKKIITPDGNLRDLVADEFGESDRVMAHYRKIRSCSDSLDGFRISSSQ